MAKEVALGRIAIFKSLILSKLVHLWLLLPDPPDTFIEDLQKMVFRFVWNRKRDRISRDTAVKHTADGGLGIPQIKSFMSALKLTWIRKLKTLWLLYDSPLDFRLLAFCMLVSAQSGIHVVLGYRSKQDGIVALIISLGSHTIKLVK